MKGKRVKEEGDSATIFHCTSVQCHVCCHSASVVSNKSSLIATLCLSIHSPLSLRVIILDTVS